MWTSKFCDTIERKRRFLRNLLQSITFPPNFPATNSAFADEIAVTVEPDEDDMEDHLNCSAAAANEPDLSGISGAQTPGQQQNRNSVLRCRSI